MVVYQAKVNSNDGSEESYVGLAKNFKRRYPRHVSSIRIEDLENSTTLSTVQALPLCTIASTESLFHFPLRYAMVCHIFCCQAGPAQTVSLTLFCGDRAAEL